MNTQAIQTELQEVINIINQAKRANNMAPLQNAIERLIKLKQDMAPVSALGGNPGGPGVFRRDQEF